MPNDAPLTKLQAKETVTLLLGLVAAGIAALLQVGPLDDRLGAIGFGLFALGFGVQHRRAILRPLTGAAEQPVPAGEALVKRLALGVQVVGVLLLYAAIAIWINGRS